MRPARIVQLMFHPVWNKALYLDENGEVWCVESTSDYSYWVKVNTEVRDGPPGKQ